MKTNADLEKIQSKNYKKFLFITTIVLNPVFILIIGCLIKINFFYTESGGTYFSLPDPILGMKAKGFFELFLAFIVYLPIFYYLFILPYLSFSFYKTNKIDKKTFKRVILIWFFLPIIIVLLGIGACSI